MKENRPVLYPELHKKVHFVNQYTGDGANYCNDLEFDVERIEKELGWIGERRIVAVAPFVSRDGTHVSKQKLYKIEDSSDLNIVRILINGRKIEQEEIFNLGVRDPNKMRAIFANQFDNSLREAVVKHARHIGLIQGVKAHVSLEVFLPQLVRLKEAKL